MNAALPPGFEPMSMSGEFVAAVGPFYEKGAGEDRRFGFPAEDRHSNPAGVIHGGVLITFLDHVLGKLVWDALEDRKAATISLNADLLAAARPGDWIEAEGEITRRTTSLLFMRGRAFTEDRTLVTASGIWKVQGPR